MPTLAIGFIGTGGIARMHASQARARTDLFRLAAASDTDASMLAGFADQHAIPARHGDYRRILEDPAIDAVVVLLPHHLHERVCCEAFDQGKHVLVEKPIARDVDEADRIIAAAARAGRTLMVGHNQRFHDHHRRIKSLLERGAIGRVSLARVDHQQNFRPAAGSWWRSRELVGGGCVIGSGIHRLDLLRWYLGEAAEVSAQVAFDPSRLEAEVACCATIRFHGGAIAEFLCHWGVHRPEHCESMEIFCSDGSIAVRGGSHATLSAPPDHGIRPLEGEPGETMWEHFHRCIVNGDMPLTSGAEGRASLALVHAVVSSGEARAPVILADARRPQLAAKGA